ncbi:MAG: ABC transporter ATP-binding protein [Archaeoglobaceae archaeon]
METDMLRVENLYATYGKGDVIRGVSFEVLEKETVAILGPNGAGKTTLLKAICGLVKTRGRIFFNGMEISRMKTHERIALGMAISPEGRKIFPNMSVKDNLLITGFKNLGRIYEIFPKLKEREDQLAGTLSGGEQQMLAIARALMFKPKLLLLDEPSLGLAPIVIENLVETIKEIKKLGVSILLVEQNLSLVSEVADRLYVLSGGEIVDSGRIEDLERIEKNYFT